MKKAVPFGAAFFLRNSLAVNMIIPIGFQAMNFSRKQIVGGLTSVPNGQKQIAP